MSRKKSTLQNTLETLIAIFVLFGCVLAMALPSAGISNSSNQRTTAFVDPRPVDSGSKSPRAANVTRSSSTLLPANLISNPNISSISPSGPTAGPLDQNITVFGSGFLSGLTVTITFPGGGSGTLSGTQIRNVTAGSFVMVATLGTTGSWSIRVNNPDGGQSNNFSFTARSGPTISSTSPSSPTRRDTDQSVQVSGSNFVSGLTVTVFIPGGGTATLSGTQIQNVNSGSFTMIVTLNVVGTYGIRVNNPGGAQSSVFNFNVQAQNPSISSISPSSPTRRDTDQSVQVSGSNFVSGLTVTVFIPGGGTATLSGTQIQNVNSGSFTMIVTLNVVGTYGIRVNNPGGAQSSVFNFNVQAQNPSISSISPSSPTRRDTDQSVQVSGSNFVSGLTVTVFIPGGGSATLSGTQIQNVNAGSFTMIVTLNVVGTYGIRVNNPGGVQSSVFNFNVQAQNPAISSISPSSPTRRDTDQSVQVSGSNFVSSLTVTVFIPGGGTATLSGTQIQNVNSGSFTMIVTLNVVGTYGIRVNNPGGAQSSVFNFNVQAQNPSISSISPSSPTRRDTDQNVQVSGSNFVSGLTVTVFIPGGGTATLSGTQIQNVNAGSFTMIVTLNVVGTYGIRVNNPGGAQSSVFNFNVQAQNPSISSISPSTPTRRDTDQSVQVSGSNFVSGLTVTVFIPGGGTATLSGTQIQNVNAGSFTMIVTLNVVGTYGIRVNNPGGAQSSVFNFNVQNPTTPAPVVSSLNPASPLVNAADQDVTVNGGNFQQNLTVTVTFPSGGSAILSGTQIQNVSTNSFVMRITLSASGNWTIRVNNPDGGQSAPFAFSVQSVVQAPTVFSLNPATPLTSPTDQNVTVFGANFVQGLTVTVNFPDGGSATLSGTQVQNVTPSSFIMRITLGAPGAWSIRVKNPDGGQSSSFNFNVVTTDRRPVINSINPSTPLTNGADQNVIVSGNNFQQGLRVDAGFPSGGVSTLQGTGQIQSVTSTSFVMRITLNAAGNWTIRVINPDGSQSAQFAFNVQASSQPPSNLPTSILSPVLGPLRVTNSNEATRDGKWEFNQHKVGLHTPTGGISLSNDTFAWDVNLYTATSGNEDAGKAVFAVSDGQVVSYVGTPPGGGPGAVLIAHPNAQNPVWFSGYLHMANVRVSLNQTVDVTTVLGEVGRIGSTNDHLHFVVYSGTNTRGNLRSFNATILERTSSIIDAPTISSIVPDSVTQSNDPQLITITGTNFQADSIIELQAPNGQYFTISPALGSALTNDSLISDATSTSITARIPFAFEGKYLLSVVNGRTSSASFSSAPADNANFATSSPREIRVAPMFGRTPVIIIPGIMGSKLARRTATGFDQIFPSTAHDKQIQLKNFVGHGSPIDQRPIVATDILRDVVVKDLYGALIDTLTGPYRGYRAYRVTNPNQRTLSGCDLSQTDANLFVFPYDWRSSNEQSARDLKGYVDCIRKIHDPNGTNNNFKVNIIAHSMGGLVARRYILEGLYGTFQNYDPRVDKLVTLGTPWLGAPKFILTLEEGDANFGINLLLGKDLIKDVVRFMPGAHQLIPSRAYAQELRDTNPGDFPFGEESWDYDRSGRIERIYSFEALRTIMNRRSPDGVILPGTNTELFHSKKYLDRPLQDNWSGDSTGVKYFNFVGRCLNGGELNTVGSLIATHSWHKNWLGIWQEEFRLVPQMTRGDCTVPEISGMRQSSNGNYLGPAVTHVFERAGHGDLPIDKRVITAIDCIFGGVEPATCLSQTNASAISAEATTADYHLEILGSSSVLIRDSFGNTTDPLSTSADEGVATISTTVSGDRFVSAVIPLDQNYSVLLKTTETPLVISIERVEGQQITQAVRYQDLTIPPNKLALLELTPDGISELKYDNDGNGTFETSVTPTASVTGASAQDTDPPVLTISETVQNGTAHISLSATDTGAGVKQIMYSSNGTSFQPYTGTLTLSSLQTPTLFAFADDNVANRSGVLTHLVPGPVVVNATQVELKSWKNDGRTFVYAKLTFPDAGFGVGNWGTATRSSNTFFADATVERLTGTAVPAISNSAQIWDLGVLVAGEYSFTFKNSGSNVKTLNFTVSSTPPPPNPIDDAREFVRRQYRDFLRREPDGPGWDHWTAEITQCSNPVFRRPSETEAQCVERKRENTSAAFFVSPEFQNTGYFVLRVYRGSLGRMPFFGGSTGVNDEFTRDAATVGQGIVVNDALAPDVMNANKQAFVNEFVTRPEFLALYGGLGDAQYVDKLFQTTGVTPSAGDRAALINGLTNGTETRASVLFKVVDGTTTGAGGLLTFNTAYGKAFYDNLFNAAFVQMEYFGYLQRDPDPGGYAFWLGKLNTFGDWVNAEMVKSFIKAPEYRARFGAP